MTDDEIFARLLHLGREGLRAGDAIAPAIVPSAVYHLPGEGTDLPYVYGRYGNPTWTKLEAALSELEQAEAVAFPSGMAAIAALYFTQVRAGDRIVIPADGYHATKTLALTHLAPLGVTVEPRPVARFLEGGFEGVRFALLETPSNPGLDVCDIAEALRLAKASGTVLAVDDTTATPLLQRPLDLGADLVISADTKALNGHSDALLGHVATRDPAKAAAIREWRKLSGAIPSPFDAWAVLRGLETLELRLSRMQANAAALAEIFAASPLIERVRYPGLKDDPSHAVSARQMRGFGFMLSATFRDPAQADRFIASCAMVQSSTSFGGVRTSAERRARWGDQVAPGFVRISAGCEPTAPLSAAIGRALTAVGG